MPAHHKQIGLDCFAAHATTFAASPGFTNTGPVIPTASAGLDPPLGILDERMLELPFETARQVGLGERFRRMGNGEIGVVFIRHPGRPFEEVLAARGKVDRAEDSAAVNFSSGGAVSACTPVQTGMKIV